MTFLNIFNVHRHLEWKGWQRESVLVYSLSSYETSLERLNTSKLPFQLEAYARITRNYDPTE
jgi:hypothetical protein